MTERRQLRGWRTFVVTGPLSRFRGAFAALLRFVGAFADAFAVVLRFRGDFVAEADFLGAFLVRAFDAGFRPDAAGLGGTLAIGALGSMRGRGEVKKV